MKARLRILLIPLALLAVALYAWAVPTDAPDLGLQPGEVALQSAGALAFSPDGILFVGDAQSAAVFALDVADKAVAPGEEKGEALAIEDFDTKIAALLGTTPREIIVNDMAVHPLSRTIYLSVARGRGADAKPALLRVSLDGAIEQVPLSNLRHAKASIPKVPAVDATNRWGQNKRSMAITDLAFADGKVYVAGLSNEEFESNLRIIPFPFGGELTAASLEIYHGAHGAYETHAPIRSLLPYDIAGKPHLLAAYTCTPLVTFPMEQLLAGGHVKGKTVAELGFGNQPLHMVAYEKEGEPNVLVLNSSRSGMRIKATDLAAAQQVAGISTEVKAMTAGVPFVALPLAGTRHIADLDDSRMVILRRMLTDGSLHLRTYDKAWL